MTNTIKVDDFRNSDEAKRHILPLNVSIRYIIKLAIRYQDRRINIRIKW